MTDDADLKVLPRLTQALQTATVAIGNVGESFVSLQQPTLDLAAALEKMEIEMVDCAYCTDYVRDVEAAHIRRLPGADEDEIFHFDCWEIVKDDPEFVADSETLC